LLLFNGYHDPIPFVLPGEEHLEWELILDTVDEEGFLREPRKFASGDDVEVGARAACLLKLTMGMQAQARRESWKKRRVDVPTVVSDEEEPAQGGKILKR